MANVSIMSASPHLKTSECTLPASCRNRQPEPRPGTRLSTPGLCRSNAGRPDTHPKWRSSSRPGRTVRVWCRSISSGDSLAGTVAQGASHSMDDPGSFGRAPMTDEGEGVVMRTREDWEAIYEAAGLPLCAVSRLWNELRTLGFKLAEPPPVTGDEQFVGLEGRLPGEDRWKQIANAVCGNASATRDEVVVGIVERRNQDI
jgi:hypothetical protein